MAEKNLKEKLRDTEQQLERALALFTISSELHKTLNLKEVYEIILDTSKQIIGVKSASIWMKDDKTQKLEKVASLGNESRVTKKYPLKLEGQTIGEIRIHSLLPQKQKLTNQDNELLTILADQAAVAITGSKLYTTSSQSIADLGKSLEETKPIPGKKLTKSLAEDLSLRYVQLLRSYVQTKNLDKEGPLVQELCQDLLEYGITPKGIIALHLKSVPQLKTIGDLETKRMVFEARMVLLKVMTNYATLLREKL